jgi:hypothetical protein
VAKCHGNAASDELDQKKAGVCMSKKQSQKGLMATLLLVGVGCFSSVLAADDSFNGSWGYEQTCGMRHVAAVRLSQKGDAVNGDWSDGSARGSGTYGKLLGAVKDGKLYVRYCGGDDNSDYSICPNYEAEASDYFVRQGKDLVWYKMDGKPSENKFIKYLVLHQKVNGKPVIMDTHCADE